MNFPLNISSSSSPRFGSQFTGQIKNTERSKGNRSAMGDNIVLSVVKKMEELTGHEKISEELRPGRADSGFIYEIPGILYAFVNGQGFDILCLDKDDRVVSEMVHSESKAEAALADLSPFPVTLTLRKNSGTPIQTEQDLNDIALITRSLKYRRN